MPYVYSSNCCSSARCGQPALIFISLCRHKLALLKILLIKFNNSTWILLITDECVNPLETPSLQKLEERSVDSFEQVVPHLTEANKGTIKIQPPPDGTQERHISSEKCLDPHVGCSFTSAEMEEDQIHRPKGKNLLQRSSSSNVRKMISTFENNISQGLSPHVGSRTKHQLSKIDIGDTLKMVPSKESNMKEVKSPQTMAKSFSAETLSEINIQQNPNLFRSLAVNKQEDMVHFDHDTRWETSRKNNQILDFKTDQNFKNLESCKQKAVKVKDDEGSSVDTLSIPRAHNSKGTTTVLRSTETEEAASLDGSAEHVNEREDPVPIDLGKGPSIMSMHGDFNSFQKKIELDAFTKGGFSLEARAPCGTSDATPSPHNSEEPEALGAEDNPIDEANRSGDKMDDGIGTIEQIVTNYFQLSHEVNIELVHKEENKNEEHTLLEEDQLSRKMLHESVYIDEPCSRYTYHSAVINGTDGRCCRSHSDEQTVSGSSNETVELSTYSDYEKCPFRSLGIWIPRYLCTTTGSKQLRNLTECCNICVPVEKNLSSMEANEKQKMHDDISIEVNKNEKISYSSEKLNLENHLAFQNYGGLVERGVRIIIIMAASGTILFNTRQKKPR